MELFFYFLVVKSISFSFALEVARSHVQELAGRAPHSQVVPVGGAFSLGALSHVHCPAGRARHEHRAPVRVFSVEALLQLQLRADCWPQEQVACLAMMDYMSVP
jgi:hypothetical protein